jgi:hypothetical protein
MLRPHTRMVIKFQPKFQVGDRVWLLRRNLKTTRPCDKLDYQRLGPFMISHKIKDVAFRLELPHHMNLHPMFHVSLLEPCASTSIPDRTLCFQNMKFKSFWTQSSCATSYIILWTSLAIRLMIGHENLLKTLAMLLNI